MATLDYPYPDTPKPGTTLEVAPGVRWLSMPLPFALDHINLWLVDGAAGFAAIDCGYGDDATRNAWQRHFATTMAGRTGRCVPVNPPAETGVACPPP